MGKSTVADKLIAGMRPWHGCIRFSFAEPLKAFLEELHHGKLDSPLFRKLAQEVGDTCRQIKPDIFSKGLCERIHAANGYSNVWLVVDDLRYRSELETLQSEFGPENVLCCRLNRAGSGLTGGLAAHPSETQCDSIPAVDVDNNQEDNGMSAASEVYLRACLAFNYRPRVYVAGPLTTGDREANTRAALGVSEALRRLNFPVFVPHLQVRNLNGYRMGDTEYYRGLSESLTMVSYWTELLVYLNGESPGRDQELRECRDRCVFNLPWERVQGVIASVVGDNIHGPDPNAQPAGH